MANISFVNILEYLFIAGNSLRVWSVVTKDRR